MSCIHYESTLGTLLFDFPTTLCFNIINNLLNLIWYQRLEIIHDTSCNICLYRTEFCCLNPQRSGAAVVAQLSSSQPVYKENLSGAY